MNRKTNINLKKIDAMLLGGVVPNDVVCCDPVELIIRQIKDDKKRRAILRAYRETKFEGYPFNIEKFVERLGLKIQYLKLSCRRDGFIGTKKFNIIYVNKSREHWIQEKILANGAARYIMHGYNREIKTGHEAILNKEDHQAITLAGIIQDKW